MNSYDTYETLYKDTTSPLRLQIYLLSYKNSKNSRINKFRTEFIAPCNAQQYIEMVNNLKVQKVLETYCDEIKILERFEKNINLLYLTYRKTAFSSPRDFVYLKLIKHVEINGKNCWCDAAKSIESSSYPPYHKIIRCHNIKSGHLIEDLSTEKENKCLVKIYSECDFKIELPLFIVRTVICSEMKKLIERIIKKIHDLYSSKSK